MTGAWSISEDGVLTAKLVQADIVDGGQVKARGQFCIGSTCISESMLQSILQDRGLTTETLIPANTSTPSMSTTSGSGDGTSTPAATSTGDDPVADPAPEAGASDSVPPALEITNPTSDPASDPGDSPSVPDSAPAPTAL
ncbi:hypothetical protein CVU37_04865 [candidate division BRC1 bacterium HGW-BRC1-1]|nr:MAG: hypothetical protein CVU37_04865 [candidate division BRC1 bacterium HGW-BRC1-1]